MDPSLPAKARAGLDAGDFAVMGIYLAVVFAIGSLFARQQKSTKDFFLAGRSMGWIPVALSLAASIFSAISFLASPSFTAQYGIGTYVSIIGTLITIPLVVWVFIPLYHRLQVYTGYEYLERRFDVRVRCMASGIFVVWRVLWMATALYVPCLALHAATGAESDLSLYAMIVVLGVVATAYTALGGMKAVIWTDVMQFLVLFGGIVVSIAYVAFSMDGGLAGVWSFAKQKNLVTLRMFSETPESFESAWQWAKWYFTRPVTVPAIIVGTFVSQLGFFSVDQVMLQRYLSVKSAGQAQRSFLLNLVGLFAVGSLLTVLGVAMACFYGGRVPEAIGGSGWDKVFPYFVAHQIWGGVAGLVIAALFAATMSSVDSGINSATTAVLVDFYQRLAKGRIYPVDSEGDPDEEARQLALARRLTVAFGAAATLLGCLVGRLGTIIEIANLIINNFAGPMLGMFLLGIFTRRASPLGVLFAPVAGVAAAFIMTVPMKKFGIPVQLGVSSFWASSIGLIVTLAVGYWLSLADNMVAGAPSEQKLSGLTWKRRKQPLLKG